MSDKLETKQLISDFKIKAGDKEGTFVAYGNTFNKVDHAGDKTMKGAFSACIKSWNDKGEQPQFLSQHGHMKNPIGIITDMKEDENGLMFSGEYCLDTQAGKEAHALSKMGALKRFSIGYKTIKEKMVNGVNELHELDVKEISLVTFACNEDSLLQSVKNAVDNGENPMRLVQKFMQEQGLSKRQASAAINAIKDESKIESKRALEIDNIKQKIKSFDGSGFDVGFEVKSSDMSMQDYIAMVCCAVSESLMSKYEDDDDVYMYCEAVYMDYLVMRIHDYRTDHSCNCYVKVPYSLSGKDNVMVGSPTEVTRLVKWVTDEEKSAIEDDNKSLPIVDKVIEKENDDKIENKDLEETEEPEVEISTDDLKSWFS